jgi:hypothetical protein
MSYSITHRDGAMEVDPPFEVLDALVAELDRLDAEHPDVAVSHESGWTLTASPSGRLLYENVDDLDQEPRHLVVDRRRASELFRVLAVGELSRLEAEPWRSGDIRGR